MKYPIGIQNFEKIRREGYVYVDKTQQMWKMVSEGSYYFLSRPRRFGKSLMISTLEAFFSGERELFKGLYVDSVEWDWQQYPILHLDLNTEKYDSVEALENKLNLFLSTLEKAYGKNPDEKSFGTRFEGIIQRTFEKTGRQAVILVDEYDKPLLQAIGNEKLQTEYRNTLKAFYGALKSADRYIKFAFLTGVTKFSKAASEREQNRACSNSAECEQVRSKTKVSVFSDLNNLTDLSLDDRYATICGISEAELHEYFDESIQQLADANKMTKEACYERMKEDYDGYHFDIDTPGMYNPFSVLNTLAKCRFRDYWFETGTPSFLVYQLKKTGYPLDNMTEEELSANTLNSIDSMDVNPLPLLYQSGYLTIKDCKKYGFDVIYTLGFPNAEVRKGFAECLFRHVAARQVDIRRSSSLQLAYYDFMETNELPAFIEAIKTFFAGIPYQWEKDNRNEHHYHALLYTLLVAFGADVRAEEPTAKGRSDITLKMPQGIYVMELKYDKPVQEALDQIDQKGYAEKYALDGRPVTKVGIAFSSEERNITDWQAVPLE